MIESREEGKLLIFEHEGKPVFTTAKEALGTVSEDKIKQILIDRLMKDYFEERLKEGDK